MEVARSPPWVRDNRGGVGADPGVDAKGGGAAADRHGGEAGKKYLEIEEKGAGGGEEGVG